MQMSGFTVETFAEFWAAPHEAEAPGEPLAEDVVGHWPGEEPIRGREAYMAALQRLLEELPGLRLEVAEHAQNGEDLFIRWIAHGDGVEGVTGIDRIKVVDGKVVENIIRFDREEMPQVTLAS